MSESYFDRKKTPDYWWDFAKNEEIIVESDCNKFPIVARFKYDSKRDGRLATKEERSLFGQERIGQAEKAIEKAEKYIEDLKLGKINPRIMYIE